MRNTPYRRAKNEERNWRRVTGNWLVITVLCFIIFELESLPEGFAAMLEDTEEIMVNLVFSAIFSLTSLLLCHFVYGKRNFNYRKRYYRRWSFLLVVAINFILSLLLAKVYDWLLPMYSYNNVTDDILESAIVTALCSLVIVVQNYSRIIAGFEEEQKRSRLTMLKFQLNPHFVFNSLSILSGLIDTNPDSAEKFTLKMSQVYRYITRNIGKDLVGVDEALKFAKAYAAMLEMRYPDSIFFSVEGTDSTGYIPSMAMQLLIENAVKHNPPAKENKLRIAIVIGNGYVVVRNNIDAGANDGEGLKTTGIGLKNLQRQYELLASDKEIMINRSDDAFEVVMPIIYKYGKTNE